MVLDSPAPECTPQVRSVMMPAPPAILVASISYIHDDYETNDRAPGRYIYGAPVTSLCAGHAWRRAARPGYHLH